LDNHHHCRQETNLKQGYLEDNSPVLVLGPPQKQRKKTVAVLTDKTYLNRAKKVSSE
jgi:hypothetical protein